MYIYIYIYVTLKLIVKSINFLGELSDLIYLILYELQLN